MNYNYDDQHASGLAQREPTTINVVSFYIFGTGTYRSMFKRPFMMNDVGAGTLNALNERMSMGGNITAAQVSGMMNRLVTPATAVESKVFIPEGMESKRLHFQLTLEIRTGMRVNYEILTGFTSYFGMSNRGFGKHNLDPNMEFYIDTYTNANVGTRKIGGQSVNTLMPGQVSQMLPDNRFAAHGNIERNFHMRPVEVVAGIRNAAYPEARGSYVLDLSSMNNVAVKSSQAYNSPSHYAATLLDGYRMGMAGAAMPEDGDDYYVATTQADIIENAIKAMRTPNTTEDVFMTYLSNVSGMPVPTSFTMKDILRIDQDLLNSDRLDCRDIAFGDVSAVNAGMGENWDSASGETIVASTLMNAIPAIMSRFGLRSLAFTSNNNIPSMGFNTCLTNANSLNQMAINPSMLQMVVDEINNTVMPDISYNNMLNYDVVIAIDLAVDARIGVSLNGGPIVDYFAPCWCSSLSSPVITGNNSVLHQMSKQFGKLLDNVNLSPVDTTGKGNDPFSFGLGGANNGPIGNGTYPQDVGFRGNNSGSIFNNDIVV